MTILTYFVVQTDVFHPFRTHTHTHFHAYTYKHPDCWHASVGSSHTCSSACRALPDERLQSPVRCLTPCSVAQIGVTSCWWYLYSPILRYDAYIHIHIDIDIHTAPICIVYMIILLLKHNSFFNTQQVDMNNWIICLLYTYIYIYVLRWLPLICHEIILRSTFLVYCYILVYAHNHGHILVLSIPPPFPRWAPATKGPKTTRRGKNSAPPGRRSAFCHPRGIELGRWWLWTAINMAGFNR